MFEKLHKPEQSLISRRELVEAMDPEELLIVRRGLLTQATKIEMDINLVNDVLSGYGYSEKEVISIDMAAYDANDGTLGSPEHPEDSVWKENPNVVKAVN